MPKHTPGPWHVFLDDHTGRVAGSFPGIESAAATIVLWGEENEPDLGVHGDTEEEAIANARLMAAAPDLLAALRLLHDNLAEYQRINNMGGYDNHDMQMARAAIAKAEGISS